MYVYIDESGDLGFSSKSTRFFVVAYLNLDYPFEMKKAMKRLLKRLHKKGEYARGNNELKCSNSKDIVKQKVLRKICQCNAEIGFVVLEKAKVKPYLKENRTRLYNFIIVDRIMRNILQSLNSTDKLNIILDRSLSPSRREGFNNYARNKASYLLFVEWGKVYPIKLSNIEIRHVNSQKEPCLQAADFLAGACFHKYEHNNNCYYRLFENRVEYFNYLW